MKTLVALLLRIRFPPFGTPEQVLPEIKDDSLQAPKAPEWIRVQNDVRIANYFQFKRHLRY